MHTVEGTIWTPHGWEEGCLSFGDRIDRLERRPAGSGWVVVPGFIDLHVHGGGGHDTMDGETGVRGLARFHARHGTTTLLPTTITSPWPQVLEALGAVRAVRAAPAAGEADVLGAHLEGPFINPGKLGAQPPCTLLPEPDLVEKVLRAGVIRVVTLAPELPGAVEAARQFARAGVRLHFGHTLARAEEAQAVMRAVRNAGGAVGGTHLFNAMSGMAGRDPGVVGALLADPDACAEVIVDGHHVHPTSVLAAWRALGPRLLLITDAMRAAGLGDGEYDLGGQRVRVQDDQARLENGSLAGSVLSMDAAVRKAVAAGIPLHHAAGLASRSPAQALGLADRGTLSPGERADLVVLNERLEVQQVYVSGRLVESIKSGQKNACI